MRNSHQVFPFLVFGDARGEVRTWRGGEEGGGEEKREYSPRLVLSYTPLYSPILSYTPLYSP